MNNFPAMTEEQRQQMVNWLEEGMACRDEYGFSGNVLKSMQIALAALNAPPAPDGWIKCSERMPEIGSRVLVFLCGKYVQSADYRQWETAKTEKGRAPRFENQRGIVYGATHWMPLPPPPEASNEQ